MSRPSDHDVIIIGGGLVGLATAYALLTEQPRSLVVLEAEDRVAAHQSGRNSGVIHSGLYYRPGSFKARLCTAGREAMYAFCTEHGIEHERCGKVVVATGPDEEPRLEELERRGAANGLEGVRRIGADELREHEPEAAGVAALVVPQTGIVDFAQVAASLADQIRERGGAIRTGAPVVAARSEPDAVEVTVGPDGERLRGRLLINCGGLQADRIARLCGVDPGVAIIPFRGEYDMLRPEARRLVRNLIYPVPDPRFPFLGVHFTRMIDGEVEAGPNAVLSLARQKYARWSIAPADLRQMLTDRRFWWLAGKHWRMGIGEAWRSISRAAMTRAMQRLVPAIRREDLATGRCGIRALAVERGVGIVDDFRIVETDRMVHVLNAPSPAATASLSIGRHVAQLASGAARQSRQSDPVVSQAS